MIPFACWRTGRSLEKARSRSAEREDQTPDHDARMARHNRRGGIHSPAVCDCQLWRPDVAPVSPKRPRQTADLRSFAFGLLHIVDILRFGRQRKPHRNRVLDHLYRAHACVCAGISAYPAHYPDRQGGAYHIDRRLYRGPIRKKPVGGRRRNPDRRHRDHSVYRIAIKGGLTIDNRNGRAAESARNFDFFRFRRHRICHCDQHGGFHVGIWNTPHRHHRASGWPDARNRGRSHCKTAGFSGRRNLGHVQLI